MPITRTAPMMVTTMRDDVDWLSIPQDFLLDHGFLAEPVANNAPRYPYRPNPALPECDHHVLLPYRDDIVWCPICASAGHHSQLKRAWLSPSMQQVWWEHHNMATGQLESDRRRMDVHLADASKRAEDRLEGTPANFVRTDYTELRKLKAERGGDITLGLDATHDRAVQEGRKDAVGKTTFPMK
jgi:hypothetical protein